MHIAMIHVVVVESHNHALEHIHTVLRQRRLLNRDWSMLHFDAHADLACPGQHIPAISCYRPQMEIRTNESSDTKTRDCHNINGNLEEILPDDSNLNCDDDGKNLYELLDATSSGIAEWILPLVLAANLRSICWVRNPDTIPLIPIGIHRYQVGVYVKPDSASAALMIKPKVLTSFLDLPITASVKVNWDCRYYLEDDSFVPTSDLVFAKTLLLTVKEGPDESYNSSLSNSESIQQSKSIVDNTSYTNLHAIDVCLDYFMCYNPFLKDIELRNSTFAKAFHDAVIQSKLYSNSYDTTQSGANFAVQILAFQQHFAKVLVSLPTAQLSQEAGVSALIPFYDNSQNAFEIFDRIHNAFNDSRGTLEEDKELIALSVEALPYMAMPHTTFTSGEIDKSLIQQRLSHMRKEILEYSQSTSHSVHVPFIITIARSTNDGFTPCHVVDYLQESVLDEIHSIYCGCSNRIPTRPSLLHIETGQDSSLLTRDMCCCNSVLDY